jgi:hypothetical protein
MIERSDYDRLDEQAELNATEIRARTGSFDEASQIHQEMLEARARLIGSTVPEIAHSKPEAIRRRPRSKPRPYSNREKMLIDNNKSRDEHGTI